jgi:hypothetical protein
MEGEKGGKYRVKRRLQKSITFFPIYDNYYKRIIIQCYTNYA